MKLKEELSNLLKVMQRVTKEMVLIRNQITEAIKILRKVMVVAKNAVLGQSIAIVEDLLK